MSTSRWRWPGWGISMVLLIVVSFIWSGIPTIQSHGYERIVLFSVMWIGMMGGVFCIPALSRRQGFLLIALAALTLRLVLWSAPVSDDVNRYLWEGSLLWKGENPYSHSADTPEWSHLRDHYWEAMNHRDRLTAYPPGMELVAAGASWLWYDLRVFKVLALLGDLWSLCMLALLLKATRRPIRWLGFYAFNPIILAAFAIEAHFDSLMIGALLTALLMARKLRRTSAWLWLGVAVQMKFIVVLLLPYFIIRGDWKKSWLFLLVLILPSIPFLGGFQGGLSGLIGFGRDGAFNGGLYETFRLLGLADLPSRSLGMLFFLTVGLVLGWRTLRGKERDLTLTAQVILSALIIGSPVVHFWYLGWIIPFVALRPSPSWLVLCLTTAIYFMAWENETAWGYHRGWVALTWWPFFFLLLMENRHAWKRASVSEYSRARSIDLVVPAYNPGPGFPGFLKRLLEAGAGVSKIIVADGGSSDGPLPPEAEIVKSERGRGLQIAAGIKGTSADLIAIIHADTVAEIGWVEKVMTAAKENPRCPAFALGQRFDSSSPRLFIVEILNEARALFGGTIFGDQTLVIRREALAQIGGFPGQPLMEDVEASWRLLEKGPILYLGQEWKVSGSKWHGRFTTRFRQVIGLMLRYRRARRKGPEAAARFSETLFREYYPED